MFPKEKLQAPVWNFGLMWITFERFAPSKPGVFRKTAGIASTYRDVAVAGNSALAVGLL
ncbi:hypothetical protein [Lamprocystis purpurea]|jgi:hypothetical protein|uniref:hypothetical protein n=1 Tax=Lamprocystis purpurea TaxID=61598 RepID=UPI00146BAD4A|nr:hypothetical protein [Lamprocystis purpurea]